MTAAAEVLTSSSDFDGPERGYKTSLGFLSSGEQMTERILTSLIATVQRQEVSQHVLGLHMCAKTNISLRAWPLVHKCQVAETQRFPGVFGKG